LSLPTLWSYIGGSSSTAGHFVNPGTRWGQVVNFMPCPLYLQKIILVLTEQEAGWASEPLWTFSFIHSTGMCRIRWFLAILRSFFYSSPLCTFSCHPSPPTIHPSSLTPSCHLFLGLPLKLVVPKFIYNTLLGILFFSTLCTCPNQCTLFNLTVSGHFGEEKIFF